MAHEHQEVGRTGLAKPVPGSLATSRPVGHSEKLDNMHWRLVQIGAITDALYGDAIAVLNIGLEHMTEAWAVAQKLRLALATTVDEVDRQGTIRAVLDQETKDLSTDQRREVLDRLRLFPDLGRNHY